MDEHIQRSLTHLKVAIKELELDEWLQGYTPPPGEGFAWTRDPIARGHLDRISAAVDADGHSGASFAMCLRYVQKELQGRVPDTRT